LVNGTNDWQELSNTAPGQDSSKCGHQSTIPLVLPAIDFGMVHTMTLGEERYLVNKHAADYEHYRQKVPRYPGL